MKWYDNNLWFAAVLILMNSNHAMSKRPQEQPVTKEKPVTVVVNAKAQPSEAPVTFIDTLNRGKEISLADKDLTPILPESTDIAAVRDSREPGIDGYRIQCLASSQIERIRSEQKLLETKVKYSLYIVFNAPYYKLLIGDFLKRSDADIILTRLKEMGYNDAWVVRSKVNAARQ